MHVLVSCKNDDVPIKNAPEWPQNFSHFKYMGIFSDAQGQLRTAVHGRIWPNFKLIRDFMTIFFFFFFLKNSDTQRQLTPQSVVRPVSISNQFEHCASPASLQEKKRSKRTFTNLSIISLWEVFKGSMAGTSAVRRRIWPNF